MTTTAAHLAQAMNHACTLPSEAMPAQADPPALPPGDYMLEIVESDYAPNSKGTGSVLRCRAQVVGGEYDGRPYYLSYWLEHENEKSLEIGQRDFAALRRATGVLRPCDTEELHWLAFGVTVGLQRRADGQMRNVVVQYHFNRNAPQRPPRARRAANDNARLARAA